MCVCVCVCVCERERESGGGGRGVWYISSLHCSSEIGTLLNLNLFTTFHIRLILWFARSIS